METYNGPITDNQVLLNDEGACANDCPLNNILKVFEIGKPLKMFNIEINPENWDNNQLKYLTID